MFTKKFSTVIGEPGISWPPTYIDSLRLNIVPEAVAGNREGVMGSFRLNYCFQTTTATEKVIPPLV